MWKSRVKSRISLFYSILLFDLQASPSSEQPEPEEEVGEETTPPTEEPAVETAKPKGLQGILHRPSILSLARLKGIAIKDLSPFRRLVVITHQQLIHV